MHDVRRLALELDAPPIVIGHSMGGLVVQQYLTQYRAAAGVLLASVPSSGAIGATMRVIRDHPLAFLRANTTLSLGPIGDAPDRAISLLFGPRMNHADAFAYADRLQNEPYPAYLEMILDLPRASRTEDPMLVLGAQCDAIFSPREIRGTAGAYNTEAIMFDDMGHDMMLEPGWERPSEYGRIIARDLSLLFQVMARQELDLDAPHGEHTRSLSDAIQSASALESVRNDDGSTTIYLQVHRREKYSTLPGLERRSWLTRVLGGRTAPSESPGRSVAGTNVRRIPRRRSDLI